MDALSTIFSRRRRILPIGLDIGASAVRAVQLESRDGTLGVFAAAHAALADPSADLAACVNQLIRAGGFHGREVIASVRPRDMVARALRTDSSDATAAMLEAHGHFDLDLSEARVALLDAGPVYQGGGLRNEWIALAASNASVDKLIELLNSASVTPTTLDATPLAILRAAHRALDPEPDAIHAILDIGSAGALMLISAGASARFIRPIPIGGRLLYQAVERRLGIAPAEARQLRQRNGGDSARQALWNAGRGAIEQLAGEVAMCLRYHAVAFRGQGPQSIHLFGSESADAQIQSALSAATSLPVQPLDPLCGMTRAELPERAGLPAAQWALAVGLSLRALETGAPPRVASSASAIDISHAPLGAPVPALPEVAHV